MKGINFSLKRSSSQAVEPPSMELNGDLSDETNEEIFEQWWRTRWTV
jgi:hypothetical protein